MRTFFFLLCIFLVFGDTELFTRNRAFIYIVQYHQSERKINTNETISLTITGNNWKRSTDQKEAIWRYYSKPETEKLFKTQFSLGWLHLDTTGLIENNQKIWMHPPRNNQYFLTEISPFPEFRKNMRTGDRYSSITYLGSGIGPWEGKKVKSTYIIANVGTRNSDSVWTIKATAEIEGKTNACEFVFSDKRGFVSLSYAFYNGDSLFMKLKNQ